MFVMIQITQPPNKSKDPVLYYTKNFKKLFVYRFHNLYKVQNIKMCRIT